MRCWPDIDRYQDNPFIFCFFFVFVVFFLFFLLSRASSCIFIILTCFVFLFSLPRLVLLLPGCFHRRTASGCLPPGLSRGGAQIEPSEALQQKADRSEFFVLERRQRRLTLPAGSLFFLPARSDLLSPRPLRGLLSPSLSTNTKRQAEFLLKRQRRRKAAERRRRKEAR